MDDRSLLPPTVQNQQQNILDTSAAILRRRCHLELAVGAIVTGGGAQISNRAQLSTLTFHRPFYKKRTSAWYDLIIKSIFGHFPLDVSFEFLVWLCRLKTWTGAGLMVHTTASYSVELSGRLSLLWSRQTRSGLTPCFWMATLVRWTNMLSSSLVLGVYLTVQNLQKPSLYLRIEPQTVQFFVTKHQTTVKMLPAVTKHTFSIKCWWQIIHYHQI